MLAPTSDVRMNIHCHQAQSYFDGTDVRIASFSGRGRVPIGKITPSTYGQGKGIRYRVNSGGIVLIIFQLFFWSQKHASRTRKVTASFDPGGVEHNHQIQGRRVKDYI